MGYEHLFAAHDLALLYDWLQQTGELYIDLDRPHSGGDNSSLYFAHSLQDIKTIVSEEKHFEVCIDIFRERQYPIRGIADDRLMASALELIPNGEYFSILSPGVGSFAQCEVIGFGGCHDELREDFTRLRGRNNLFGRNPFDKASHSDFFDMPDDVWSARSYRQPHPHVSKNRTSYAPFESDPDGYRPFIASW